MKLTTSSNTSINSNIQFTTETEIDRKISFFDMNIKRNEDHSLSFGVNRKSTNSGKYFGFQLLYHHAGHKRSVVMSLNDRADKLCSDQIQLDEEKSNIMNQLNFNVIQCLE